jgi:hypothetical protein
MEKMTLLQVTIRGGVNMTAGAMGMQPWGSLHALAGFR